MPLLAPSPGDEGVEPFSESSPDRSSDRSTEPVRPDLAQILEGCYYKERGTDQRGRLVFTIRNQKGRVTRKLEFVYLWKQYRGRNDVWDKLMLFAVAPPEYRDNNYLRITYTWDSGKLPEQWVYSKRLQRVRRLSLGEQDNMHWGLINEDLSLRRPEEDAHTLLDVRQAHGQITYEVESRPRLPQPGYVKYLSYYVRTGDWGTCRLTYRDYYDAKGRVVKKADYKWQQIDEVWLLASLDVVLESRIERLFDLRRKKKPVQVFVHYQIQEPEVNAGIDDHDFSLRNLRRRFR